MSRVFDIHPAFSGEACRGSGSLIAPPVFASRFARFRGIACRRHGKVSGAPMAAWAAASACRETRHAAQEATAAHGNCLTRLFPLVYPLRQNFTPNRALVTSFLAHNLPQNFPVGVAVVGACPPTATDFELFLTVCGRLGGGRLQGYRLAHRSAGFCIALCAISRHSLPAARQSVRRSPWPPGRRPIAGVPARSSLRRFLHRALRDFAA